METWMWIIAMIVEAIIFVAIDMFREFGTLRVDHSNPEKDIYRLEIKDLDKVKKRQYIILRVDNNADLDQNTSQK